MKSLQAKLLLYYIPLVGFSVLVLLGVLEIQFYLQQRSALLEDLKQTADVQQLALADGLWEYDAELTRKLALEAGKLPYIHAIQVFDAHHKLIAQTGNVATPPEAEDFSTTRPIMYKNRYTEELVGYLHISVHSDLIIEKIMGHMKTNFLIMIVLVIALIMVTWYVTRRIVLEPMNHLYASIQRMDKENIWTPVAWDSQDEIGKVVSAYNALQGKQIVIEQELIGARKAAESSNRAKSAFLANMSHELRTPLNGILGYAQILLNDHALPEGMRNGVETILRSGNYLLILINDVLDLAKIEAGRFDLQPGTCELHAFFRGLAALFRPQAEARKIRFEFHSAPDLPALVEVDEIRLRQIVANLLANSIKFTKQGCVRLEAGYRNGSLLVGIEDTGIGIEPDLIENLFRPFQQSGDQRCKNQGSGLGLAICKNLVEHMDGKIEVQSRLGEGSRFYLSIPLERLEGAVPEKTYELERHLPLHRLHEQESTAQSADEKPEVELSNEIRETLVRHIRCGSITEIQSQLDTLPANAGGLVAKLREAAANFDIERLESLLESELS